MSQASESPLETMYRRRPSFRRPPIRDVHSPRLTEDEADLLTSPFLSKVRVHLIFISIRMNCQGSIPLVIAKTNSALFGTTVLATPMHLGIFRKFLNKSSLMVCNSLLCSQSYNPDKPPAWEVPNINNNLLHITNQENVDYAAPSIMRSLGQAGYNAFRTFFNVVLWVLYTITVRPVKSVGFLLYDTVVAVVYLTRCLGESITGFLYSKIEERRRPFRRRSFFDLVIVTFFKLVYGIASVIRYPVDLICSGFRAINLALTRKYYELLAANGRRLNNQAMIERMRKMNKETAECNHWMMLRKAE
ncbi:hypothetical protein NECAME_02413, partial [Necator americanus]